MYTTDEAYFVTQRCFQGRPLMAPTPAVVRTIGGILAKATHKYSHVRLHDAVFMSNHYHLIISAAKPEQIPRFMAWLSREISVRIGHLVSWRGSFFERRYDAAPILDDDALLDRMHYIRKHGVKEGLTPPAERWPGLTLLPELIDGSRRTFTFRYHSLKTAESLCILVAPMPGWESVAAKDRRVRHREITRRARAEAHEERRGKSYLGSDRVVSQDPQERPARVKQTPRVRCFASTAERRREFWRRYQEFVDEFRASYHNLIEVWQRTGCHAFFLPRFVTTT
jgi:REP element-mobilizing transposase RayT